MWLLIFIAIFVELGCDEMHPESDWVKELLVPLCLVEVGQDRDVVIQDMTVHDSVLLVFAALLREAVDQRFSLLSFELELLFFL